MCVFVSQLLGLLMYAPAGLDAVILRYCLYGVAKCSHTHTYEERWELITYSTKRHDVIGFELDLISYRFTLL